MPYMSSWLKEYNRPVLHVHQIKTKNCCDVDFCCGGCYIKKEDNNEVEIQQKREWDKTETMKLEINKVTML